jgi:hypothetical protein
MCPAEHISGGEAVALSGAQLRGAISGSRLRDLFVLGSAKPQPCARKRYKALPDQRFVQTTCRGGRQGVSSAQREYGAQVSHQGDGSGSDKRGARDTQATNGGRGPSRCCGGSKRGARLSHADNYLRSWRTLGAQSGRIA